NRIEFQIAIKQWRCRQAAAAIQIFAQRFRRRRAVPANRCLISMSITKTISALTTTSAGASRRRTRNFKWTKIGLLQAYLFERPLMSAISAVLILTGLCCAVRYYVHERTYELTDNAFIEAYTTQVSPQVSSNVLRLHITDNQRVNVGDLLAELDPRDFEARLADARAALEAAEARHRAAKATVEQTRITRRGAVAEASSGVTAARADLEIARAKVGAARHRERAAPAQSRA